MIESKEQLFEHQPSSSVLFLTICSLHKNRTSSDEKYRRERSIVAHLKDKRSVDLLYQTRKRCLKEILEKDHIYNKMLLRKHEMNLNLKPGPDFYGSMPGKYLPAIDRYIGRFYVSSTEDGQPFRLKEKILSSQHHTLIISGLYGLVTPEEQIQLYESPLEDIEEIQQVWKEEDALTRVLMEYIRSKQIRLVVDLTGQRAYHDLINWNLIKTLPDVKILYAMSSTGPGPDQLQSFGAMMYTRLLEAPEEDIFALENEKCGDVLFRLQATPPKGEEWPVEPSPIEEEMQKIHRAIMEIQPAKEEDLALLFDRDQGKALIDEIKKIGLAWNVVAHPYLYKDLDRYSDQRIKKLMLEKLTTLLTSFPVPRSWGKITETQRFGEFMGWRLRIGDYRLQFFTVDEERLLFLQGFSKRQENQDTYDFSKISARKIRSFILRSEETD